MVLKRYKFDDFESKYSYKNLGLQSSELLIELFSKEKKVFKMLVPIQKIQDIYLPTQFPLLRHQYRIPSFYTYINEEL